MRATGVSVRRRAGCAGVRAGDGTAGEMLMRRWRGGVMMCRGLRALGARTLSDEACALGRSAQNGGRRFGKRNPHNGDIAGALRSAGIEDSTDGTTKVLGAWVRQCLHSLQEMAERGWQPSPSLLVS